MNDLTQQANQPEPKQPDMSDSYTKAMLVHLSCIFFGIIVPLVMLLVLDKTPDKAFLLRQSKEALNFQITVLIAVFVCTLLSFIVIGFFLIWLVILANLILCIMAALAAQKGQDYQYPLCLRLVK